MHGRSVSQAVREPFAFPWTLLTSSLLAPRGGQKSCWLHDKWWRKWDNLFRSLAFCSPTCLLNCFMLFFLIPAARATTALRVVTAQQWEEPWEEEAVEWHTLTYTHSRTQPYVDIGIRMDGETILHAHSDYCISLWVKLLTKHTFTHFHKHTHTSQHPVKWSGKIRIKRIKCGKRPDSVSGSTSNKVVSRFF